MIVSVSTRDRVATNLSIAVRRARPDDKAAVLPFASATFDGWDYIPQVWDAWLDSTDGVVLVATAQDDDRPLAMTRVVVLSDTEGWLEGIRVDPAQRGRGIATNLQIAELAWAQAHGLRVLRYLTGHRNTGSIKLGAHHGFRVVGQRRFHGRPEDAAADGPGDRSRALTGLAEAGLLMPRTADAGGIASAWRIIDDDATFAAGDRLYEHRPWALQVLDAERFAAHVRVGEVLVDMDGGAVAIMPAITAMAEDDWPHFAVVAGDGRAALRLAMAAESAARAPIAIRLPDPDPPLLADPAVAAAWASAGFKAGSWGQLVLERWFDPNAPLPAAEPAGALTLRDRPVAVARPPAVGADR